MQRVAAADAFAVLLMHPEASGGGDDDESEGGDGGGEEGGGGDDASVSVVGVAAQADSGGKHGSPCSLAASLVLLVELQQSIF